MNSFPTFVTLLRTTLAHTTLLKPARILSVVFVGLFITFTLGCSSRPKGVVAPWTTSYEAHSPVLGNPRAKITIVEFVDFQCGACKDNSFRVKDLLSQYPQEVRVVFKHYPLPQHPQAIPAAEAALAAAEQGKFWSMHDRLFEHQSSLNPKTIDRLARELDLNMNKFQLDMLDVRAHQILRLDHTLAKSLGVQAVPALFINGEPLRGIESYEDLQAVVERHLRKNTIINQ